MTLSRRLLLAMVMLAVATAVLVSAFIYRDLGRLIVPAEMRRLESNVASLAAGLKGYVASARADALALRGSAAVDGVIGAREAGGRYPRSGVSETVWKAQLAQLFEATARAKKHYVRISLIGLDDGAREIVRVDRTGRFGTIDTAAEDSLQRMGEHPFVPATVALAEGQAYVSPVRLGRNRGAIAHPLMPMLRTGTPVYWPDGKPFGLVVIDIDMRPVFDEMRASLEPGAKLFVANAAGDYLVNPDPRREFGFEFGHRFRLQDDFPSFKPSGKEMSGHLRARLPGDDVACSPSAPMAQI